METSQTLKDSLRSLRYQGRLDQVALVSSWEESSERQEVALAIVRELALQRVFERFTKAEEAHLLDQLMPLTSLSGKAQNTQPAFGNGAKSNLPASTLSPRDDMPPEIEPADDPQDQKHLF